MQWIVSRAKWILLVSGALTCTMIRAAIAPQAALRANFGDSLEGPLAEIIVRSWGVLIALVGAMLIYAAYNPASRGLVLLIAGLSKLVFIGLVLAFGDAYLGQPIGIAVVIDSVMVVLFACYLAATRRRRVAG